MIIRSACRGLFCGSVGVLLLAVSVAPGQNLPQITIEPWQDLAPGIRWTRATATSPNWQIRLIEADLSNRNVDLQNLVRSGAANQNLTTMVNATPGVVAAVNSVYFSATDSVSHARRDGVTLAQNIGSRPPRATFGLTHHGSGTNTMDLRINRLDNSGSPTTPMSDSTWGRVLDAAGGGPNLITAGNFDITTATEGFDAASGVQPDSRQPRTALGIKSPENKVIFMTVDGRQVGWSDGMTVTEVAKFLKDLGCDYAMNYDGGGSTTAVVNGTVVNRPSNTGNVQRALYAGWGVVSRVVLDDTDSAEITMTPTAWSTSANAGFYNSGSRFQSAGANASIAFRPNLARTGQYRVEARWVAAANRATNTAVTIEHATGTAQVQVNQTLNGSQWQFIGIHDFTVGTSGSVSLSASSANGIVSADAVRWTYIGPASFVPAHIFDWQLYGF